LKAATRELLDRSYFPLLQISDLNTTFPLSFPNKYSTPKSTKKKPPLIKHLKMPSLLKFLLHRPDHSRAQLRDVKEHSNQLSSQCYKQSGAIIKRLDKMGARLNDRFDKIDARLGRLDARLGCIEARLDAMDTKLKQVEWV
jgi:hypothetical protein